jgi:hypothetical protein
LGGSGLTDVLGCLHIGACVVPLGDGRPSARAGEVTEDFEDLEGAELKGGVVELGGIEVGGEVGGGFLTSASFFEPGLFEEPILVTAFFPLRKVIGFEVFALVTEALDDVGVRDAVEEPMVDLVADGFGEASDFAVAAVG